MATPKSPVWPLEPHTLGKHLVLKSYLDAWYPILGRHNSRILFIDGFAGPGEYTDGEEGSPVIALKSLIDHDSKPNAQVVFFFIENEERRVSHLREAVQPLRGQLPNKCKLHVIHGRFDSILTEMFESIDRLAPAFVMVDPFGVAGAPMEVFSRLFQYPKCEVYVSFMYEAINRFRGTREFESHLDELFGCVEWRDGIDMPDGHERKRFFFNLYTDKLRQAGARHVVHFELYEGNRLVYAIFFATTHWIGADRMKAAIWKVAPFGEFTFRGTHVDQPTLGLLEPDFIPLRKSLSDRFSSHGWVGIAEVEEFVGSDETDYHKGQLRKGALIPMELAGEIEVDAATRRRARSYPQGTRLRFP